MKSVSKLQFLGLAVFWIIQVNPLYIYNMSLASGYGYGTIRAACYACGISLLLMIALSWRLLGETNRAISMRVVLEILPLLMLVVFSTCLNMFRHEFDLAGAFPLIELFVSVLVFSLFDVREWIEYKFAMIVKVVVLFMVLDIVLWVYSYLNGDSYGVFRAYVNGITINRMADLFLVPAAVFLLFSGRVNILFKIASLVFIGLTFYRTVYLAALITLGFIIWKNPRSSWQHFFKLGIFLVGVLMLSFFYSLYSEPYLEVQQLVVERFVSTFTVENENEWSQSARMDQLPIIFEFFINNPIELIIGAGSGFVLADNKIYNYFNYPLIMMVMYGIFAPFLFLRFLYKSFKVASGVRRNCTDIFVLGFAVYFFVVINIFPYMVYFPVMSVFAFVFVYFMQRSTSNVAAGGGR